MKLSTVVSYLAVIIQGIIMTNLGYGVETFEWWAITILTCIYGISLVLRRD